MRMKQINTVPNNNPNLLRACLMTGTDGAERIILERIVGWVIETEHKEGEFFCAESYPVIENSYSFKGDSTGHTGYAIYDISNNEWNLRNEVGVGKSDLISAIEKFKQFMKDNGIGHIGDANYVMKQEAGLLE